MDEPFFHKVVGRIRNYLWLGGTLISAAVGLFKLMGGASLLERILFVMGIGALWIFLAWVIWALARKWLLPNDGAPTHPPFGSASPSTSREALRAPTQEQVAERLSFIQHLRAVANQLERNTHYNISTSLSYHFTKFCETLEIRAFVQQDDMADIVINLLRERFFTLARQYMDFDRRSQELAASTLSDKDIDEECSKIRETVLEYRRMMEKFMELMNALAKKGVPAFWEKAPWPVTIHKNLADDYDELMRLVKDLRNATPRAFQSHLPDNNDLLKFPRATLVS